MMVYRKLLNEFNDFSGIHILNKLGNLSTAVQIAKQCPPMKPAGLLQPNIAGFPGQVLAIDLAGPSSTQSKWFYLFVGLCRCFYKMELYPLCDALIVKIIDKLEHKYFPCYNTPYEIITNNGAHFRSELLKELCTRWKIYHKITPYHL